MEERMGGVKRLRKRREIREARKTRGVTRGDPKSEPYARGYVQEIGFGHIEALLTRALWPDKRFVSIGLCFVSPWNLTRWDYFIQQCRDIFKL